MLGGDNLSSCGEASGVGLRGTVLLVNSELLGDVFLGGIFCALYPCLSELFERAMSNRGIHTHYVRFHPRVNKFRYGDSINYV
jgi:hypothetical protein